MNVDVDIGDFVLVELTSGAGAVLYKAVVINLNDYDACMEFVGNKSSDGWVAREQIKFNFSAMESVIRKLSEV